MKKLISLIFIFLLIPLVSSDGEGEVELINPTTLIMSYDSEIRELNNSIMVWAEDTPIQFWETDKDLIIEYEIINNNFFALTLTNSPTGREREYPIFYCTTNEIPDYDRYNYRGIYERCKGYNYVYKLRDIREGRKINIKIPPLEINPITGELTNAFSWIVGNGAGGGGGLPVCSGLVTNIYRNETSTHYLNNFKMGGIAGFSGSGTAGCTANYLYWEEWNGAGYTEIPTTTTLPLDRDGVLMRVSNPSWNNWYYKYPLCELSEGASVNIRIRFEGTYQFRSSTVYSPILTHTCEEEIIPEPETNLTRSMDSFVIEELILNNKKKNGYWLVMGVLPLILVITRKKIRND